MINILVFRVQQVDDINGVLCEDVLDMQKAAAASLS